MNGVGEWEGVRGKREKALGSFLFFLGFGLWPIFYFFFLLSSQHTAQHHSLAFCTPPLFFSPLSGSSLPGFFQLVGCGEGPERLLLSALRRRWGSKVPFLQGKVSFYGCCFFFLRSFLWIMLMRGRSGRLCIWIMKWNWFLDVGCCLWICKILVSRVLGG